MIMIVYYNKEEIDIKIVFDIFFDHELSHLNIYRLLFYCILGFEPSQRCLAAPEYAWDNTPTYYDKSINSFKKRMESEKIGLLKIIKSLY